MLVPRFTFGETVHGTSLEENSHEQEQKEMKESDNIKTL